MISESYVNPKLTYKVIDGKEAVQGSPEWLAFKKGKFGASQAATVMGLNPYQTKNAFWIECVSGESKKFSSQAMKKGLEIEPAARAWISKVYGLDFQPMVIQCVERPYLMASLDGFAFDERGEPWGIEIKNLHPKTHQRTLNEGVIPEYYVIQMQAQMALSGAAKWVYVSWSEEEPCYLEVKRNEDWVRKILNAFEEFKHLVDTRKPPELEDNDAVLVVDPDIEALASQYADIDEAYDQICEAREIIRQKLFEAAAKIHSRIDIAGKLLVTKTTQKGKVDYSLIPELAGVDLDKYRGKEVEGWRITKPKS
jgi:putative phage-type endonuclease